MGRFRSAFVVCLVLAAGSAVAAQAATGTAVRRVAEPVSGSYLVTFSDAARGNAADVADGLARRYGAKVDTVFAHAIRGFAGRMSDRAAVALAGNPQVAMVEQNGLVRALDSQANPPWGLDRIDQRNLPLNSSYIYDATGAGVRAYVIDTGIRLTHAQLGGRAINGTDTIDGDAVAQDCNGHGTHVAGTIGGSTYGVAKAVSFTAVRVLDCQGNGTTASVIGGIDWVTGNHQAGQPAVANMSLGGGASSSLDTAVRNSINDGITYAIAAGNGDFFGRALDACTQSPARVTQALTVSATSSSDAKASWANYGTCVDLFAPGVSILSSWNNSDTATNTISGTSMATPHVAGVAAQYLEANQSATPADVGAAIVANATPGTVSSPGTGTPNLLLYSAFTGSGDPPGNQPPTANFASSCEGLSCSFTDTSTDDAGISARSWTFGDGTGTTGTASPSHTYAAPGTYAVMLTVTDTDGATDSYSSNVTVTAPAGITLTATKQNGKQPRVNLSWSGTSPGGDVTVYRNGAVLISTSDDGAYADAFASRPKGTFSYRICETDTGACSNTVSVTF